MLVLNFALLNCLLYFALPLQAQVPFPQPMLLRAHELNNSVIDVKNNKKRVFDVLKAFAFAVQATIAWIAAFALLVKFFMLFVFVDVNLDTANNRLPNG